MTDTNRVILTGRLTRDPELKSTASGQHLCRFSIANNYAVKQGEQWTEKVNYFDVVAWGRQAETIHKYVQKGQKLLIEGVLRWSSWEHDGEKQSKTEVLLERFEFMGQKPEGQKQPEPQGDPSVAAVFSALDEDIPF